MYEEEEVVPKEYYNALELQEEVEKMFNKSPDGRTKVYKIWKEKINELIKKYNKIVGFKAYIPIK